MKHIVKVLAGPWVDPDTRTKAIMERTPCFHMTRFMRRNLEKIWAGMGGDSRDIAKRPIRQGDRTLPHWVGSGSGQDFPEAASGPDLVMAPRNRE